MNTLKRILFWVLVIHTNPSFSQDGCTITPPDSLRVLGYPNIYYGDVATFVAHGGALDSLGRYAFYYDHCCDFLIGRNASGIIHYQLFASDIFFVRIESPCDTTDPVGIDLDVYPPRNIPFDIFNLWGQQIPTSDFLDTKRIIQKRLLFK